MADKKSAERAAADENLRLVRPENITCSLLTNDEVREANRTVIELSPKEILSHVRRYLSRLALTAVCGVPAHNAVDWMPWTGDDEDGECYCLRT
jgi:hypothetical protein